MKIKDMLIEIADLLSLGRITEYDDEYKTLFRCANLVVANAASNYIDFVSTQTFNVTNEKIDFDQFDKTFLKVKSVKKHKHEISYQLYIGYMQVPNGKVEVQYACVPSFENDNDETFGVLGGVMNDATLIYGIMAEYAFISGMWDDAKAWNEKFGEMLFATLKTGRVKTMPARFV